VTLSKINAENWNMHQLAKKACKSYLKSVFLMREKSIFNINKIDKDKLAESFGLANPPEITFGAQNT
jgi:ATP-dependent RNA helicase DDX10/DBP4